MVVAEVVTDAVAASASAVCVTPIVAAVDKAVAESLSGEKKLWESFFGTLRSMAGSPVQALRRPEFRYVWGLFAGTYMINNVVCSFEQELEESMARTKTFSVFSGNMCLALWKDSAFARIFGSGTAPKVPPAAYGAWAARDVLGMGVVFALPPVVAPYLADATGLSQRTAETVSQFILPMAVQPLVAPFHQLGYLMSFNPSAPLSSHASEVRKTLGGVVVARWIRGFPPYCIGATANKNIRYELRSAAGLSNSMVQSSSGPMAAGSSQNSNLSRKFTASVLADAAAESGGAAAGCSEKEKEGHTLGTTQRATESVHHR